jgi:(S)-2-hydroxyglutarate dehydrogenase
MNTDRLRIIIIGGGIVGLATAYKLGRRRPDAPITLLEKEASLGRHQTGNNSGVLHAGLYYKPGSAKARLAVSGIREMVAFCQENRVPHEICGKLVVAADETERARLQVLYERGQQNGLQGLQVLQKEAMREIEPHVGGVAALRVPQEGIVDYPKVCTVLADKIAQQGGRVVTSAKVQRLDSQPSGWVAQTPQGDFEAEFIVNCAGLHCDRVAELAGETREVRIIPFRGEYYKIRPERQHLVRNLIYPVPDPQFPFLGVHFTRLIHGGIEAGPNAVLAFAREGYRKTDVNLFDLFDALTFPGLWRFLGRHKRMSWQELKRSFSRKLFCESLGRLVPEIRTEDLAKGGAGVRAQAMSPGGELVQDFCLVQRSRALHVLNAPSPAATASLAIGEEIAAQVVKNLEGHESRRGADSCSGE